MSKHTSWPAGAPCWTDITVTDLARSQTFDSQLLGWEFTQSGPEFGGYSNAMVDGMAVAGMSPPMEGWEVITAWTVYLASDDIKKTHEAVIAAGGTAQMEPMEVGDFGWMGLWLDPAGALFGAWQQKQHTGFELFGETGAPAWCDLMSQDRDTVKRFFSDVFGFTYSAMGEDPYDIFNVPGREGAGGLGQSDGTYSGWNVAFQVENVDTSMKVADQAGGRMTGEAMDFEFGRMAPIAGPDGESFAIYSPKQGG